MVDSKRLSTVVAFFVVLTIVGLIDLDAAPVIDWDEGWTFSVAQNWVEHDFYGRQLNGAFAPPGLEASFPVVATVALSFKVLGGGVLQGRLVALVTMLSALALFFFLLRRLYSFSIAFATLLILVLLLPHPRVNAFWMARQMFAEPLMLLALVGGFLSILLSRSHSRLFLLVGSFCWGTAIYAKTQAQPFAAATLIVLVLINFLNHRRREGLWMVGLSAATFIVWRLWFIVNGWAIAGHTLPPAYLPDALTVFGFVPTPTLRVTAFILMWLAGAPVVLGLLYLVLTRIRRKLYLRLQDRDDDIRIGLWVLASLWLLWFVGAAHAGIARYLFPALFFGAPFAALMFATMTNNFDVRWTLARMAALRRIRQPVEATLGVWFAFLLVLFFLPLTLSITKDTWRAAEGRDAIATTTFLNTSTPADTRIETYESSIFLGLQRSYHYPPDALHLELNKRAAQLPANVAYDPLANDPDYLVIGPTGHVWNLYDAVVASGAFRPLEMFGQYEILQRVRP